MPDRTTAPAPAEEDTLVVCRTCGRDFIIHSHQKTRPCPGCQSLHARPRATGSSLADLRRAHTQRAACQFTDAERNYQLVLNQHPDEAEALWGLALCQYGVAYVTDDRTGRRVPVLHFLQRTPFTENNDYRLACARATEDVRPLYLSDGAYISQIQQDVLAAENSQETWDIFLCYKQSVPGSPDPDARTREFNHARDLYEALRDDGYKVFFAYKLLPNVAGAHYEAKIFNALQTARVMLVVCSNPDYLRTPWVHSEWSRYLQRVDKREDSLLIPLLYDACSAYALPDPFIARSLQCLDMRSVKALDDLRCRLKERIRRPAAAAPETQAANQSPDMKRALLRLHMALEDGAWQKAEKLAVDLIDEAPDCGEAHLCLLLARRELPEAIALAALDEPFETDICWRRAMRFADPALKKQLDECLSARQQALDEARRQREEEAERRLQAQRETERILRELEEAERLRQEQEAAEQLRREQEEIDRLLREQLAFEQQQRAKALNDLVCTLEAVLRAREQDAYDTQRRQRDNEVAYLYQLLQQGDWAQAERTARAVCAAWPTHVKAHLGMVLAAYRLHTEAELAKCAEPFETSALWQNVLQHASDAVTRRLELLVSAALAWRVASVHALLQQGDWAQAHDRAEALCRAHPDHGPSLLCKFLADLRIPSVESLNTCTWPFEDMPQWASILEHSVPAERMRLNDCARAAQSHRLYLATERDAQRRREEEAEELLRQYEEEANRPQAAPVPPVTPTAPQPAVKTGTVVFQRIQERFFNKTPIHLYLNNEQRPFDSLLGGGTACVLISAPVTIRARTADSVECFTWEAQPGIVTQIEVRWPLLGKPRFTAVSSTPIE